MKSYNNLYPEIYKFENLLKAANKAQKGKTAKHNTARFNTEKEKELLKIQRELIKENYLPGNYTTFYIYDPKKRMISAAPYRDRVVHHALCNIIEPLFEKSFIYDSYANRKGKGTHKAIKRYQSFCRKNKYVLKCDIKKYFPSIDHKILKSIIRKKIACNQTYNLIKKIIDGSNPQEEIISYFPGDDLFMPGTRKRGLPIGNLTSQFFANLYLSPLDHFIKDTLGFKYYIRYVDDFVIFHEDKKRLNELKTQIERFLVDYRIKLHDRKSRIFKVDDGVEFLGFRVFPAYKLLKKQNIKQFKKRMKCYQAQYKNGKIAWDDVTASVQSWIGHAKFGNTFKLRSYLLNNFVFEK